MKTNDLIDMMTQESQAELKPMPALTPGVLAAAALSAALLLAFWGIRPDLGAVAAEPLVALKFALPLLTALPCLWLVERARRPDAPLRGSLAWTALPLLLLAALVVSALQPLAASQWLDAVRGQTLFACLFSIPALAAPILGALLWLMRDGASSRPALAGTLAGLAAGCLATGVYALHCYEDSPAFYGIWYTAAVALTALAGRQLGRRVLHW